MLQGNETSNISVERAELPSKEAVLHALGMLLESPEFRQSEQSKRLMRHMVEMSCWGEPAQLRERAIGAAIFGLEAGYDTAENPIVRVRVNELRKRLAKYYQQAEGLEIRFEIPARGYRVEVVREAPSVAKAAAKPVTRHGEKWAAIAVAMLLVLGAGWWMTRSMAVGQLEKFWGPAMEAGQPVVLCAGHPVVYRLSRGVLEKLRNGPVSHYEAQTMEFRLPEDAMVAGRDIVALPDQYIGLGTAEAVARLHGFLRGRGRESEIRFGNDLAFADLRKSPAVIMGAFQNRWMVEFMKGMRFVFDPGVDGAPAIRDQHTGRVWKLDQLQPNGKTPEDYVLISRLIRGTSGEFVILGAGITQYGGHTVGEILTEEKQLGRLLAGAAPGWENRNLQILVKVKVIGRTAGPPELVALHEW